MFILLFWGLTKPLINTPIECIITYKIHVYFLLIGTVQNLEDNYKNQKNKLLNYL